MKLHGDREHTIVILYLHLVISLIVGHHLLCDYRCTLQNINLYSGNSL